MRAKMKERSDRATDMLGHQHVAAGDLLSSYSASCGHSVHRIVRVHETSVNPHADAEAKPLEEGITRYSVWPGENCWICGEWRPVRGCTCVCVCGRPVHYPRLGASKHPDVL